MLKTTLLHPPLLAALAAAGHGDRVLVTDANFPLALGANATAQVVYLNLRRGLVSVNDVLEAALPAFPVEAGAVMASPDGAPVPAHEDYRKLLGESVPLTVLQRFDFYAATQEREVALVVVTGDTRLCANLLLTVGVA